MIPYKMYTGVKSYRYAQQMDNLVISHAILGVGGNEKYAQNSRIIRFFRSNFYLLLVIKKEKL